MGERTAAALDSGAIRFQQDYATSWARGLFVERGLHTEWGGPSAFFVFHGDRRFRVQWLRFYITVPRVQKGPRGPRAVGADLRMGWRIEREAYSEDGPDTSNRWRPDGTWRQLAPADYEAPPARAWRNGSGVPIDLLLMLLERLEEEGIPLCAREVPSE